MITQAFFRSRTWPLHSWSELNPRTGESLPKPRFRRVKPIPSKQMRRRTRKTFFHRLSRTRTRSQGGALNLLLNEAVRRRSEGGDERSFMPAGETGPPAPRIRVAPAPEGNRFMFPPAAKSEAKERLRFDKFLKN